MACTDHEKLALAQFASAEEAFAAAQRFAERLRPLDVTCNAMHPGWADTPGVARSLPRFRAVLSRVLRDDAQGADTMVWLACAPQLARATGRLYFDREACRTEVLPGTHHSAADVGALWTRCEALTSA